MSVYEDSQYRKNHEKRALIMKSTFNTAKGGRISYVIFTAYQSERRKYEEYR